MLSYALWLGLGVLLSTFFYRIPEGPETQCSRPVLSWEVNPSYWERLARVNFQNTAKLLPGNNAKNRARNVILFMGDGMGAPSIAATRFYKAFKTKRPGEAVKLVFEKWPFATMCRTYDLETMVTDSASSATAYLSGTKTRTGVLGLTGHVVYNDCRNYTQSEKTESVLKAASRMGLATGIVTNTRITHASPAGAYGHAASRDWESDAHLPHECNIKGISQCSDLAKQLVLENLDINVILGGGEQHFYPREMPLPGDNRDGDGRGTRIDRVKLVDVWLAKQEQKGRRAHYLNRADKFHEVANNTQADYLMGLLAASHMPFEVDRKNGDPSLADMTRLALNVLKRQNEKNNKGFFLFVEGGRIDHAHHFGKAKKALEEVLAFEEAVIAAMQMVDLKETLMIVTADHSHSFHLVGEPNRFQNVLEVDETCSKKTLDGRPMTAVGYMNGPGARVDGIRNDLRAFNNLTDVNFQQQALVPLLEASHGGEDVGVYAIGCFSHLFHRTIDNTHIAQSMKYALCLEPFSSEAHCLAISSTVTITRNAFLFDVALAISMRCVLSN